MPVGAPKAWLSLHGFWAVRPCPCSMFNVSLAKSPMRWVFLPNGKALSFRTLCCRSEGMVVLAWVLGRASLPMFDVQCEPSEVANAMGFLAERESTVLPHPLLRDASEVSVGEETYLTLHWRLRQFSTDSKPMDLAAYVAACDWGPLRLDQVKLCEGDIAIDGVRIDRLPHAVFRQTLSIVQERHRAFNWLIGWDSLYSQVTTDT